MAERYPRRRLHPDVTFVRATISQDVGHRFCTRGEGSSVLIPRMVNETGDSAHKVAAFSMVYMVNRIGINGDTKGWVGLLRGILSDNVHAVNTTP